MKSLLILTTLMLLVFFLPSPYLKTTTTCPDNSPCYKQREYGFTDSLFQTTLKFVKSKL